MDETAALRETEALKEESFRMRKRWLQLEQTRGNPILPHAPMTETSLRKNAIRSILISNFSVDEVLFAKMLYSIGPLSLAEASKLLDRNLKLGEPFLECGLIVSLDNEKTQKTNVYTLSGAWSQQLVPGRLAMHRPPTLKELREFISWVKEATKTREAPQELFHLLMWIKRSSSDPLVLGKDEKPLTAKQVQTAASQLDAWEMRDGRGPHSTTIISWARAVIAEHPRCPDFIPVWPED